MARVAKKTAGTKGTHRKPRIWNNPFALTLLSNWHASRQAQESHLAMVATLTLGFLATLFADYNLDARNIASVLEGGTGLLAGAFLLSSIVLVTLNYPKHNSHARTAFRLIEFGDEESLEREDAQALILERRSKKIRFCYLAGLFFTVAIILDWVELFTGLVFA